MVEHLYRKTVCLAFVVLFLSAPGFCLDGGGIPVAAIQELMDRLIEDTDVPGMVVGVDVKGERWIGVSGVADLETGEIVTPDTQFRLASVTKTFTAILLLKLAELGNLSLDDNVEKWLPGQLNNAENITISMLLNHTSGLFDHENVLEFWNKIMDNPLYNCPEEEVLQLINENPPNFAPGTAYEYCNSGYYLLGMIAEKVRGDTVDHLTQQYIFSPAGMSRSRLTREGELTLPFLPGYFRDDRSEDLMSVGNWNFSWDWTAGSGVSTAGDLISLVRALFSGTLLGPEWLARMTTPIPPSEEYGYGVDVKLSDTNRFGEPVCTHGGYNPGTFTGWYYFPESDMVITLGLNYSEYREEYVYPFAYAGRDFVEELHFILNPSGFSTDWEVYR
ncbi:MAG TPA: serine hydrolase domain-containing protein [bacterium]|nr:serine hydrolase domain-containing protein [bacterium]